MPDQPHMLVRDIETRSTVDLGEVGLYNYATHPSTEVLCVGYCVDDGPTKLWWRGDPIPDVYREAARNPDWTAVAHNAPFEMAIERFILGPRHGFPIVPLERNLCTMAVAQSLALPASLGKLAKALDCAHQKDSVGSRLMLQMVKPRKPRKSESKNGAVYWFEDSIRMDRLGAYCIDDVETTREIALRLPWLTDDEYTVWLLDQKINACGIQIDRQLATAARRIAQAAAPHIDQEMTRITNGQVTSINQVAKLSQWLTQFCKVTSLDKTAIDELLALNLPAPAQRALELRYLGAQAAAKKVNTLLAHCDASGRVCGAFVYHAAGTGRWSSRGAQLHNMKRSSTEDIAQAVAVIGQGDFDAACKVYDNPLSVIGDLIRAMVCAAPGHVLIGADFSGIEARVTAWLAGEEPKLEVFRAFDNGNGPDPYIIAAARIFNINADQLAADYKAGKPIAREQRQCGKACELAFGFGGGLGAFKKFEPNTSFSDKEIQRFKTAWRRLHPNIETMWQSLNNAAWKVVRKPGIRVCYKDKLVFEHDGSTLWITLPSGRRLSYPEARIARIFIPPDSGIVIETAKGIPALIFKDNSSGRWHDVKTWHGVWVENVVQAIARDLLAQAMLRLDESFFQIVAHVHDEAICEIKTYKAKQQLRRFHQLMIKSPHWADGLPIVAKAWSASRYVK
jgi:DNA polymerase